VALCNQTFETGKAVEGEWRTVGGDGSVHWIAGRFQAFKDSSLPPARRPCAAAPCLCRHGQQGCRMIFEAVGIIR
jgi:hypothetical protein